MKEKVNTHLQRSSPAIGILGIGRLGSAFSNSFRLQSIEHKTLDRPGFLATLEASSTGLSSWVAECGAILLCVRDDQLEETVSHLSTCDLRGKTVLMHAGALPLGILRPLAKAGAICGKFHPLMSFSGSHDSVIPKGTPFAYEGNIVPIVQPWIQVWESPLHLVEGDSWQWYHLAAVMAANFLPILIRTGAKLMAQVPETDQARSLEWLSPLVRQTVANALDAKNQSPFSGPAVRGDWQVLAKQEALLLERSPEWAGIYRSLSERIAQDSGIAKDLKKT